MERQKLSRWRITLARKDSTMNASQAHRRMTIEVMGRGKDDALKNAQREMARTGQSLYFTIHGARIA